MVQDANNHDGDDSDSKSEFIAEQLQRFGNQAAPNGLKYKIGDRVNYVNTAGVTFRGLKIIGFYEEGRMFQWGHRYHVDTDCYWFPVQEKCLSLDPTPAEQS